MHRNEKTKTKNGRNRVILFCLRSFSEFFLGWIYSLSLTKNLHFSRHIINTFSLNSQNNLVLFFFFTFPPTLPPDVSRMQMLTETVNYHKSEKVRV